jgi:hypothetical protein
MADKGTASLSASVFMDDIKSALGGTSSYEPKDSNDKWLFAEVAVGNSSADLVADRDYLGTADTTVVADDDVAWIAIKNTSTTSTDGIAVRIDAGTAAYNTAGNIYIGSGEMVVLKTYTTPLGSIHAISVTMDGAYGYPSATHAGTVSCQVAAIVDDGGV